MNFVAVNVIINRNKTKKGYVFMLPFVNKFISVILVPLYMSPFLPFLHIAKLFNLPGEVISLSANGISSEADPVYLTAHRGVSTVAPQNTLPSYQKAVELGYYSAECDIHLTKDNKWVLMHNSNIDSQLCQYGEIKDYTLEELKSFSYKGGSNFWAYEDLKVSTLEEYLDVFVGSKTRPQIEIKAENYDLLYTVVDAVKAKGLEESAIIISFDLEQLKTIREYNKEIELWYLIDEITEQNIAEAKALGGNVWLSPNFEKNTAETIQLAIDAGVKASYWTVNELEDAKMLYDMGIRYIETDIFCN